MISTIFSNSRRGDEDGKDSGRRYTLDRPIMRSADNCTTHEKRLSVRPLLLYPRVSIDTWVVEGHSEEGHSEEGHTEEGHSEENPAVTIARRKCFEEVDRLNWVYPKRERRGPGFGWTSLTRRRKSSRNAVNSTNCFWCQLERDVVTPAENDVGRRLNPPSYWISPPCCC